MMPPCAVMSMRVAVTGGNGFIGAQALTHLVDDGHEVLCFDIRDPSPIAADLQNEVTFVKGDVMDPAQVYDTFLTFEPDGVIDLASLLGRASQEDPRRAVDVNLQGSLNVVQAASSLDVDRVVTAASVAVYGRSTGDRLTEETPRTPDNVYGMTKYALEELGATYQHEDLDFVALEPVHGLGPDRRRGNVEDAFVCKAAVSGTSLTVPNVAQAIEIIYVVEEARAFVETLLADNLNHNRYIVGTGEQATLPEIAEMVEDRVPQAEFEFAERRGDDQLEELPPSDTSRIRDDVGWKATVSVDGAVDAYIKWLQDNPSKWSFDPSEVPWED